jgi:hypothetical protein
MKRGLAGFLVVFSMLAASPMMTNQTVEAMVYGGVPLATIISAIKGAARIQLSETRQDYDRLVAAGSSPAAATEIMKAIHARQYNGVDRWPAQETTAPVQGVAAHAGSGVPTTAPPQLLSAGRTPETNLLTNQPIQPIVAPAAASPVQVRSLTPDPAPKTALAPATNTDASMSTQPGTDQRLNGNSLAPAPLDRNVGFGGAAVPPSQKEVPPRVYLQSASKGTNWNAARDQSMEMSRDLERNCPGVKITVNQQAADYIVLLNHIERGLLIRDNQIQVANREGDLITNTKEGGSIAGGMKRACMLILYDWSRIRQPAGP